MSTETLELYIQFLSRSFKAVQSIKNYVSGIKTWHKLLGFKFPDKDEFQIKLAFKGISRLQPHCIKQALPITPEILIEIYNILDLQIAENVVFWALFVFAFFMMARKSNLVPDSTLKFDPAKHLLRQDVLVHKKSIIVFIKWSKTIQFGEKILQIPLLRIKNNPLCPVTAYKNMCKIVPTQPNKPAFIMPNNQPVTYKQFQIKIKELIKKTGYNPNLYSSHSFRRGGASFAFSAGVRGELVQLVGDWKSDAYLKYLKFNLNDKIQIFEKMRTRIYKL